MINLKAAKKKSVIGAMITTLIAAGTLTGMAVSSTGPFSNCGPSHNLGLATVGLQYACPTPGAGQATCGLTAPAFCDTFDNPGPIGDRSGDLNGTVWGVSRARGGGFNSGQQQNDNWVTPSTMYGTCAPNTGTLVSADNDVKICNGQLNEMVNDNLNVNAANQSSCFGNACGDIGDVTALTAYPKQPFDFAGRTGKITFDVSDDSGGTHVAWPEFWMSDKPVPNPFIHFSSWQSVPQNGFGIRLSGVCEPGQGPNCAPNCPAGNAQRVVTVASMVTINNYQVNDSDTLDAPEVGQALTNTLPVTLDNCVTEPTAPLFGNSMSGQLNHFEVDVSTTRIDVYGTNAFTGALNLSNTPLVHLASVTLPSLLTFTRGLIWLEDAHYNGNKNVNPENQAMHTFVWDNVGFDGPILTRDLTFDAPDSLITPSGYPTSKNLGYYAFGFGGLNNITLNIPGVNNIGGATATYLMFNTFVSQSGTITYSLNGHTAHTYAWPFPGTTYGGTPKTFAIPILASELQAGTNSVTIGNLDPLGEFLQNVDILLANAGGPGGPGSSS